MSRFFLPFLSAVFCLFSSSFSYAAAQDTLNIWQYVQDPDSNAAFGEISDFLLRHPSWPDQKKIQIRAERAMRTAQLSDSEILSWFSNYPPISGVGKWTYAETLYRQNPQDSQIDTLIKEAWRDGDFTADEEETIMTLYGARLDKEDHIARTDRLLWESKITPARRMLSFLSEKYQVLAQARMALQQDERNASFLVNQVSNDLGDDPGLLFDRMRYRQRKNDKNGVRDILLHTPPTVPYPERWWKIREAEIRRAIDERNYHTAEKLLANHAQSEGTGLADALWLDGWVKLEFLNNAPGAYSAFSKMYDTVRTPVSKARAAYWAGRAAQKKSDTGLAIEWFNKAAEHPTAFYGQLAATELGHSSLSLPSEPGLSFFSSDPVLGDDLEEAIRICIQNGDAKLATRLINHVVETAESERSVLNIAALGHELSAPHISVKAAKKAQQRGVVLKDVGYPRPATEADLPIERPLTLAITRQESEFDPFAESPAGALGMMQLLPGTARDTAKKIDVLYNKDELVTPTYNLRLGSTYLSRMINAYDGSYVMAIASYNAGPGNVRKWMGQFGTPQSSPEDAINWIEKIPFAETRNYVQRVMENLQVYRALEGGDLKIKEDLLR